MAYEESILIKVDKTTKEQMKTVNRNWSKAIRMFINEELRHKKNIAKAVAQTYRILEGQKKSKYDSTSVIRKLRDERYGPSRS
jgi:antitoxin component of RelBE/YafQ-DinJ toxin-antitoxin module